MGTNPGSPQAHLHPQAPADAQAYDRRLVGWLSVTQLITWGSVFYTFALLMEPVEQALGLTRAQSSLGFSLALLAEGLCAYPVGRWIDRGHERVVMAGGSLAVAAMLALHGFVTSMAGFYAVWAGLGAALAATLYNPVFAVVTRRFPDDFRRAIITLTFLGGLASTVFIPLSAWLIRNLGWREALWVLAGLQLFVCAPLHWRLLRNAPAAPGRAAQPVHPVAASAEAGGAKAGTDSAADGAPGTATPLAAHLRSAPFLLVGVFVVIMLAVTAALPAHMISLLREAGLQEAWVIAIPASIGLIQVLGRLLLFFFEHHFDLHVANRVIPCLIPLGLVALLASQGHSLGALVFVLLYGLGNGMMTIVKGTAIAQYVSREHVATLNGALGLPSALTRALAPLALGLLWSRETGYREGLFLLLAASVVAVLALYGAQRKAMTVP